MKTNLLSLVALCFGTLAYSQCTITGIGSTMCITELPVTLGSTAPGGVFSGPGVSGSMFDPAAAGLGTHTIDYVAPGVGYTVDQTGTYAPVPAAGPTVSLCDDDYTVALPIGFTFNFFGVDYTTFQISSNGYLSFGSSLTTSGCCSGQFLPNSSTPNNLVAFGWEDFNPGCGSSGTIQYQTIGSSPNQILVVSFTNVPPFGGGTNLTTQIQCYELDNHIEIHTDQQGNSGVHTQGIENASGTEAYFVAGRNATGFTLDNDWVAFFPNIGCTTSIDVTVGTPPTVIGSADVTEICLGESVTLTSSGDAVSYSWGSTIVDGVPYTPSTTGLNTFVLAGTGSDGCVATDNVSVFVHEIPTVLAPADFSICEGFDITLEGAGTATSYVWNNGVIDGTPFTQNVGPVTYTVTGTNDGGCEASDAVIVTVLEAPSGSGIVSHETAGNDGSIDFTPSGGAGSPYTYAWSNGSSSEDIMALTAGDYTVTVNDGTCNGTVTFTVINQLSIEDNEIQDITVYPNPVNDILTIDYKGSFVYNVYDIAGKLVLNGNSTGLTVLDVTSLEAGQYQIKIVDGESASTFSIIKK